MRAAWLQYRHLFLEAIMNTFKKFVCLAMLFSTPYTWAYDITITEPSEERAYHRPAQNIEITAHVSPKLKEGHTAAILLNDKVIGDGLSVSVPTLDLTAGEYTVAAIIMDKQAKTVAKDSKTVYIIQTAPFARKKAVAIKARETYEALPWYKKLAIGLNPNVQAPPNITKDTPIRDIQ